jgi:CRP-like cAMP-binding protein
MDNEIARHLSKYIDLTEELERALSENLLIRTYSKGTVLLKEGGLCSECYFIIKGLIRSYYLNEVEEITADFYMEEQVVSPSCYGTKTPSRLYLECLEETIAYVGTPELESEMYSKYPELAAMSQAMGEKIMSSFKDSFDDFKMSSPEQRYLNLVKNNPELIQRAPQYQIASYLGIKPESLSRIRKRLSKSTLS